MNLDKLVQATLADEEIRRLFSLEMLTHENELYRFLEQVQAGTDPRDLKPWLENLLDIPFFTNDVARSYGQLRLVVKSTVDKLDRRRAGMIVDAFDSTFMELRSAYTGMLKEARSRAAHLAEINAEEMFAANTSIEQLLYDTYEQISAAIKSILKVRNLAIALRKGSSVSDLSRAKLLGEIDPSGSFSRYVYADFDKSLFVDGSPQSASLKEYEEAIVKNATLIHSRIDPFATRTRRLAQPLFWYCGMDMPQIFERDRGDDGRELSLLLNVATYVRDYYGDELVQAMYNSLAGYYLQMTIPIRDRHGHLLALISADGINAAMPRTELSPMSHDLLERFNTVRREEGMKIYEHAPEALTDTQRELILSAYATVDTDPEEVIKKHGFFILSRTQWNRILERADLEHLIRTERFVDGNGVIGYEIAPVEWGLYREFFTMPVRPVRGYQLRIAEEFADMLAPHLLVISAYYQHGVDVARRVMKRIDEKRKAYLDVVAHRMKNSLGPLAMSVNRLTKQVDRLQRNAPEDFQEEVAAVTKRIEVVNSSIENLQKALNLLNTGTASITTRNLFDFVKDILDHDHYLQAVGIAYTGERSAVEVSTNFSVLEEVMRIVVENAREAILTQRKRSEGFAGSIDYAVDCVEEDAILTVTNYGPPLPDGVDPFSDSFTTSKSGKGLGLARYLMSELNGRIEISNRMQGERFLGVEVRLMLPTKTRLDVFDVGTIYGESIAT